MSKVNIVLDAISSVIILSRLRKQTRYEGECWIFTGTNAPRGYKQMQIKNKKILTHRLSAAIFLELDLQGPLQANHKLICPNKACWNPDHLYIGTQADNMLDVRVKIRESNRYCKKGHLITKIVYVKNKTRKVCEICLKDRHEKHYAKIKGQKNV